MTVPASARATYVGLGTGISTGRGSDYAALSRLIRQDGLLNRRPGYYATKICIMAVLYIAGWAAVAALGASWYQLLAAVYLAAVFGQLAFVGHEAGHRQIFRSRRGNDVAGLLLGNLLIGLSFGWWTGKHNRHHAHPNQLGKDPDLDIPAIAFTAGQAAGRHGLYRLLARYQAYLFFPMLLLEAVSMHLVSSWAVLHGAVLPGTGPAAAGWKARCCWCTSPGTSPWSPWSCPRPRPSRSSSCSRACSASTWAAPSLRTTRACRCSASRTTWTSSAARCSPRAT